MKRERVLAIVREVFVRLSRENPAFSPLPDKPIGEDTTLDSLHVTDANIGEVARELRARLGGIALNVEMMYKMQQAFGGTAARNGYTTIGDMVRHIQAGLHHGVANPVVVYVDDEEENLFVFRRRFAKRLNLRTYSNPSEALEFIRDNPDVVLVLTDEAMPGMTGTQLCDEAHKSKPFLKFMLITGNPGGDEHLMEKSLRHGKFYDFINKPLDFEKKGEEYFAAINQVLEGEAP